MAAPLPSRSSMAWTRALTPSPFGMEQEQVLAGQALFDKVCHFVGGAGDLVLRAGQRDHLREGAVRHLQQVGDQDVVVLFVGQALAVEQGGKAQDLAGGAVAAAHQVRAAAGVQAEGLPRRAASQEALGRVGGQEQVAAAGGQGLQDDLDPERGKELGFVDSTKSYAGQYLSPPRATVLHGSARPAGGYPTSPACLSPRLF